MTGLSASKNNTSHGLFVSPSISADSSNLNYLFFGKQETKKEYFEKKREKKSNSNSINQRRWMEKQQNDELNTNAQSVHN